MDRYLGNGEYASEMLENQIFDSNLTHSMTTKSDFFIISNGKYFLGINDNSDYPYVANWSSVHKFLLEKDAQEYLNRFAEEYKTYEVWNIKEINLIYEKMNRKTSYEVELEALKKKKDGIKD